MDTIGYHQQLATLAHDRGDHVRAARHYQDAANCYESPERGRACLQMAEQELAYERAIAAVLAESQRHGLETRS